MNILDELKLIFRDVFDDDSLEITEETNASDIEDWDSLTHILLLQSVETKFNIRFTTPEVVKLANVGDLITLIGKKLN